MNIIILHHFDYPEGMATTKRFKLFAEYFQNMNCRIIFILKTHQVDIKPFEYGIHKGIEYFKVFFQKNRKYPFFYDRRQNKTVLELIEKNFEKAERNILITGGITPEFYLIINKLLPNWELFCDYVEDYTLVSTLYDEYKKTNFLRYLKLKLAVLFYNPIEKYVENFMFKKASGISAISPYLFNKAKNRSNNVISIPITANYPTISLKSTNKPFKSIFFAGSGSLKDGLDIIAKAFNNLVMKYDVYLKISGKISLERKNEIKKYSNNINKIILLGFLSDKEYFEELEKADILLITRNNSKFANAGFPYKLGEYLATAKPVITTNVSGIDQYLINNKSAIIICAGDAESLEKSIVFLLENPEIAKNIGLEGKKVFEKHFLAEKNCKKLYEFILNH